MKELIIIIALCLIYFNIGGLATTNIIRLTAGNNMSVNHSKCICDNCGANIPPVLQLPIVSYMVCRGKCKSCGCKIPIYPLLLEISIFLGMSIISLIFSLSIIGVSLSFLYYEIVRIIIIVIKGKRKTRFINQYIVAVVSMIPFYLCALFVSLIYKIM